MAAATKRATPPTHPTVWIGLGLSAVGLLLAVYSYTGTRVYDITYALVALAGGILALAGILTAAWGRAVMSARASRGRRTTIQKDAMRLAQELPPPTVAQPASKKRFTFPKPAALLARRERASQLETTSESKGALFAFRARSAPPPSPARPDIVLEPLVEAPPVAVPLVERLKLKCPSCAQQFAAEGERPFTATCPHCGFAAEV